MKAIVIDCCQKCPYFEWDSMRTKNGRVITKRPFCGYTNRRIFHLWMGTIKIPEWCPIPDLEEIKPLQIHNSHHMTKKMENESV